MIRRNKKTTPKRRPIISSPSRRLKYKPKPMVYEYVILLHKVGVSGVSRARFEEVIDSYRKEIADQLTTFGNIKIKNIVVPCQTVEDFSIEVVYPTIESISEKLKDNLSTAQERKLKIFKLLEDL